ncbi:DUF4825 domain-containing protein [Ammoniphilus sp. YIM 78166]|uniref:DUF4825 domain-containing protein n=1 Tax=Ammoniphilus sp. YIM 78166 TaxID=1644106 RepID=UPI0010703674|nr:DUF4825 domain-containing protein [Ammoniphilus sp. YIM 78166]
MKQTPKILSFLMIVLLILNGCSPTDVHKEDDLFQYKNSYVGDNGAVGKIASRLPNPNGEHPNGMELQTKEEPFGIILNYIEAEKSDGMETNYKELALYNATFILALVHNAEWVQFNFVEKEFIVTREKLHSLYEKDIRQFNNEEELRKVIIEKLEDEDRVHSFFN